MKRCTYDIAAPPAHRGVNDLYVRANAVPGGTVLAVTMTSSTYSDDPLALARKQANGALELGYATLFAYHRQWWSAFWARSSVTVPHAEIQQHYNLVQYFYGAASRPNAPPMALQGLWTADAGTLRPGTATITTISILNL